MLRDPIQRFRLVAFLEGVSFILLLGVAVPLKHLLGMPGAVRVIGMAHGLLFLLYLAASFELFASRRWSGRQVLLAVVASLVPFGTFVLDARIRRDLREPTPGAVSPAPR